MKNLLDGDYEQTKEKLNKGEDEVIISDFLRLTIDDRSLPGLIIEEEEDVLNENPSKLFVHEVPIFVIVKAPRDACGGNSDGSDDQYGCWRIMGGAKLIKSEETGKVLGFKKILKFCIKTKPREYKRSWVMEEYRLVNKWKQDRVICKIQLLFQTEISFLLAKHFSLLVKQKPSDSSLVPTNSLPDYGVNISNPVEKGEKYMEKILEYGGNSWPEEVTNDVYNLHPLTLVDLHDEIFVEKGICFFANRTPTSDIANEVRWSFVNDKPVYSRTKKILGYKRVFRYKEQDFKRIHFLKGSEIGATFFMDEYRVVAYTKDLEDKVLCVIKAKTRSIQ